MKNIVLLFLILTVLSTSCYDNQEGCTCSQAINYNSTARNDDGSCIYDCTTSVTTGSIYQMEISAISQYHNSVKVNDEIKILMNNLQYSFSQASSVDLYLNEALVHSFGSWLYFENNTRSFTIPTVICSGCYTIRVFKSDDVYISEVFTINN